MYNGYTNYETWVVNLWLDSDQGVYNYWREEAQTVKESAPLHTNVKEGIWKAERAAVYLLASQLKEEIEEAAPELEGMFSDLLGAALSEVEWYEIAENFLEE